MTLRPAALALAAALCAGGLAARAEAPPAAAIPADAPTLRVAIRADVDSWNPYVASQAASFNVLELLYPRLVHERLAAGGPSFTPWLASSWSVAPDGRRVTFRLRPEARWSDGRPVTCEDVRFTLRAQRADELAWPGLFLKQPLSEVRCPDPATAVFEFSRPVANAVLDANDDAVVPSAYAAVPFADWGARRWEKAAVTAGPYRLVRVVPGQEAVLERAPDFWEPQLPAIGRIAFRIYGDAAAAFRALLAGDVDFVEKIPPQQAREVAARPDLALIDTPSLAYAFIAWNTLAADAYGADRKARGCSGAAKCSETPADLQRLAAASPHPILADARVRTALTLATDRDDLVRGLFDGRARAGGSPVVSALWAHDPQALLPYDPARARQLLDAAGWKDKGADGVREHDGRALQLEVIVDADNALRREALERVAANLALVGVRVVPRPLPRAEFLARARDKNFDGALSGWRAGTRIEPQGILHSRAALNRGNNLGAWSTPASDALLDRAAAALSVEQARPLWVQWQRMFRDEQPYTILYEERTLIGINRRVEGATPSPLNPYDGIERWRLAPPTAQR